MSAALTTGGYYTLMLYSISSAEFCTYLHYVRNLDFFEVPDYAYLRRLFQDLYERSGFPLDGKFDWSGKVVGTFLSRWISGRPSDNVIIYCYFRTLELCTKVQYLEGLRCYLLHHDPLFAPLLWKGCAYKEFSDPCTCNIVTLPECFKSCSHSSQLTPHSEPF